MATIVCSKEASECLEQTYNYIARDNLTAAFKVVDGIYEKVQVLSHLPQTGHPLDVVADREIRETLCGSCRIAYLIRSPSSVEIPGIFHDAMNIEEIIPFWDRS